MSEMKPSDTNCTAHESGAAYTIRDTQMREEIQRAKAAERERDLYKRWYAALETEGVSCGEAFCFKPEDDAKEALHKVISWNVEVSHDPAVSERARKEAELAAAHTILDGAFADLWLVGKMCDKPGWPSRQQLVLAACACAETSLKYVRAGEERPRLAIETARKWARGEATIAEVRSAADAAAYAAYVADAANAAAYASNAAAYASNAAAYASYAAAYAANAAAAAAYAAYAYAAKAKALAECADIVRREIKLLEGDSRG